GQGQLFLELAAKIEGEGRDADALAFWRDEYQFRNLQLVELPRGDFGFTILRQFLFFPWSHLYLGAVAKAPRAALVGLAAKAHKENRYHLRHSSQWVLRLGGGTEESHARVQAALDDLWPWTEEFFYHDDVDRSLGAEKIAPDGEAMREPWTAMVNEIL